MLHDIGNFKCSWFEWLFHCFVQYLQSTVDRILSQPNLPSLLAPIYWKYYIVKCKKQFLVIQLNLNFLKNLDSIIIIMLHFANFLFLWKASSLWPQNSLSRLGYFWKEAQRFGYVFGFFEKWLHNEISSVKLSWSFLIGWTKLNVQSEGSTPA